MAKPFSFVLSSLCLSLALVAACGGARTRAVELDPIEFKVDRQGGGKLYVRDYRALSAEAADRMRTGDVAEALRLYDVMLREFGQEPGIHVVQFNAGLALLKLRRPREAAQRFADARRRAAGSRDARDALFLQAQALDEAGQALEAAAVLRLALDDAAVQTEIGGPLGILDELEASARVGIYLRKGGDLSRADEAFKRVARLYQDHRAVSVVAESEWVARALYERGEIYRGLFASIRFQLPVERMKRDLEDKSNLFLKAESAYFQCVRLQHKAWALAAGYEIGHLYTQLIEDIDTAEAPPEIDASMVDIYRDELWNHTERLAKRAVVIYKKNVELATRMGQTDSDWVRRSEEGLARMEQLIETAKARRVRLMTEPVAGPGATTASDAQDSPARGR